MIDAIILTLLTVVIAVLNYTLGLSPMILAPILIASLAILYTRRSALEQKQVAERKLFVDLMPRRIEWLDQTSTAFMGRFDEQRKEVEGIINNQYAGQGQHLTNLFTRRIEAEWLFGSDVADGLQRVLDELQKVGAYQLEARQGSMRDPLESTTQIAVAYQAWSDFKVLLRPFLYVGDIKTRTPPTPTKAVATK